jgi:hypothetical protein
MMDIVVLDFTNGKVYVYWGAADVDDSEKIEAFLEGRGFLMSSISWMCHPMLEIVEEGDE